MKYSTGWGKARMDDSPLRTIADGGFIKIYGGSGVTPPASADAAVTGTLLATISLNSSGTGLTFDTSVNNPVTFVTDSAGLKYAVLIKPPAATWSGLIAASGDAVYFRYVKAGDTGALSTTDIRAQGTIGVSAADMLWTNIALVSGNTKAINLFQFKSLLG